MTAGVGIFKGGDMRKIRRVNLDEQASYYRIFKSPQPLNGALWLLSPLLEKVT